MTGKLNVKDLDLKDRKVFVRVDYNVPLKDGTVSDDRRVRGSLETLNYIVDRGGRPILASHLGRPKGKPVAGMSLEPVARHLATLVPHAVRFVPDCVGPAAVAAAGSLGAGEVLVLENLRFHPEEEKNDPAFAGELASLADLYVNDAFGAAHRAHASTAAICGLVRQAASGFLMEREISALSKLLEGAERPYFVIMGGAKVSDKIPLATNLLGRVDGFLIGGAMSYTFLKEQGIAVGDSLVESGQSETARRLLADASARGVSITLPVDHVVLPGGIDDAAAARTTGGAAIGAGERGVDIGPESIRRFRDVLASAKTILWNGPLGWFERAPFDRGTREIANALA
jgi:phosphoglycerate kinase